MSQAHKHFLGAIADKKWKKSPGSFILIELGGTARAAIQRQYELLQGQAQPAAIDLAGQDLTDFSVRQVTLDMMDALSGGVVTRLTKEATKAENPIAVPGDQMRHVLLLTEEYDELRATRLAILPDGTLQVSVACEYVHNDAVFAVKGAIDLKTLLAGDLHTLLSNPPVKADE
jgi:hypothetical protein